MGGDLDDLLKGGATGADNPEVPNVPRRSLKLLVLVVVVTGLGVAAAGAAVTGVDIGDPLGLIRAGDGTVTQVLPTPPPSPTVTTAPASIDAVLRPALLAALPGAPHEGVPHGVPPGYDWGVAATSHGVTPPSSASRFVNLWGQVYAGANNVRPANTRVAVAGCELWRLPATGTQWERIQGGPDSRIDGGAWSEDFQRDGGPFDLRTDAGGQQSMTTANGWNAHFWTTSPLADPGMTSRAFLVACSTRLVLANPSGSDDRAQSSYLVSVGLDWRTSNYGCPTLNGVVICSGVGVGRMIRPDTAWRRVVMLSSDFVGNSLPLPPVEALQNPDGTYRT